MVLVTESAAAKRRQLQSTAYKLVGLLSSWCRTESLVMAGKGLVGAAPRQMPSVPRTGCVLHATGPVSCPPAEASLPSFRGRKLMVFFFLFFIVLPSDLPICCRAPLL